MKKIILVAAIALAGFFIATPEAEAGPRFSISIGNSFGGHGYTNRSYGGHGYSNHNGRSYSRHSSYNGCAPAPYVVRTCEVCRRCQRVISYYQRCGTPVYRTVTIVTYQQIYSNGSRRTFTRTI